MNQPIPQPSLGGFCDVCGSPRIYKEPWRTRDGQPRSASWACPNKGCTGHRIWIKGTQPAPLTAPQPVPFQPPGPQTAQAAPGTTNGHAVTRDAAGRSIEAQTACKAACEAFQGSGLAGSTPNIQQEWIIATAQGLLGRVIDPYVQGKDFADGDLQF